MAVLLMKLRMVPDDELAEVEALLEANGLEYYTTSAGVFGISMPGLWLVDDTRRDQARALLDQYAVERQARVREEWQASRAAGTQRTVWDMARERPLRWIGSMLAVGALLYVSLVPFW